SRGSIVSSSSAAIVRTNGLDIETPLGSIGTSSSRVNVDLVQSASRPTSLSATAGQNVFLNLTGRLRDSVPSTFTLNGGNVQAGADANLLTKQSVREPSRPSLTYTVTVSEPLTSDTTTVTNRFRPAASFPALVFDLGVLGTGSTSINDTYSFGLLQAGGNVSVTGFGTGRG